MTPTWTSGPGRLSAAAEEIHVWRADLDRGSPTSSAGLPAEERERAAKMRPARIRERWIAARWALRRVLARYLGEDPVRIALRVSERGKPGLAGSPPPLHFNLSHSGDLAFVAVTRACEVGVDVERIDPSRRVLELARIGLGAEAADALRSAPAPERVVLFHEAWARHEAIAKCLGTGLGVPLPDSPVSVSSLVTTSDFAAAVAVARSKALQVRQFTLLDS